MYICSNEHRDEMLNSISDLYKDAHGVRPRGINYGAMSNDQLSDEWSWLCVLAGEAAQEEHDSELRAVEAFESEIERFRTNAISGSRLDALRWMFDAYDIEFHYSNISEFVYELGLPFSFERILYTEITGLEV